MCDLCGHWPVKMEGLEKSANMNTQVPLAKVVTNRAYISWFIDVDRMGQELCLFEHTNMKSIMGDSSDGWSTAYVDSAELEPLREWWISHPLRWCKIHARGGRCNAFAISQNCAKVEVACIKLKLKSHTQLETPNHWLVTQQMNMC